MSNIIDMDNIKETWLNLFIPRHIEEAFFFDKFLMITFLHRKYSIEKHFRAS